MCHRQQYIEYCLISWALSYFNYEIGYEVLILLFTQPVLECAAKTDMKWPL